MNPLYTPYADDEGVASFGSLSPYEAGVGARAGNALAPPPYLPARVTGQDWVNAGRLARNAGQAAFVDPLWDMTQGLRSILHGDFSSQEAASGILAGIGAMAPPGLARDWRACSGFLSLLGCCGTIPIRNDIRTKEFAIFFVMPLGVIVPYPLGTVVGIPARHEGLLQLHGIEGLPE